MFDTSDLSALATFALLVLIPGFVETSEKLGISGNAALVLSLALGAVFVSLAEVINLGIMPEVALPWIRVAAMGVGDAGGADGIARGSGLLGLPRIRCAGERGGCSAVLLRTFPWRFDYLSIVAHSSVRTFIGDSPGGVVYGM
jgi:hypothetical protein